MIPCNCPCGLKLELRAIAAPGSFHAVCDHCLSACSAAARTRLEMAVAEVGRPSTRRAADAFAGLEASQDAYTVSVAVPARP